jgi:predicted acylesterase/phospholipase RssA
MDSVLLFGVASEPFSRLHNARPMGADELHLSREVDGQKRRISLQFERDLNGATRRISCRAIDCVVVDARQNAAHARALLERLFGAHDGSGAIRRGRVTVVVNPDAEGIRLAEFAGTRHLSSVMVAPSVAQIIERIEAQFDRDHARGKIAICLAGGGIEGLLYELGVLRALDEFLVDRKVIDVDLFCGISAGAILGAFLANGLTPAEIVAGLRRGTHKLDRMTRSVIFDPNVRELAGRLAGVTRDVFRSPSSALYRAIPSGVFAGESLRKYLKQQLRRPGMSDSFASLRRPLFVGATDQDTNEAVVFGEPAHDDVPVHLAVRASSALVPFYAPQKIGDRYFIDGAFTRTTNMRVAVKQGATLVLLVDPLVPVHADHAGYVHKRGGLFGAMQGLKCLVNGRFDKAEASIREMYPEVAFRLFRPEGDEMRILSGSPMKFLFREEVEQLAYENTRRKLLDHESELARDFARNGWTFRAPTHHSRADIDLGPLASASV